MATMSTAVTFGILFIIILAENSLQLNALNQTAFSFNPTELTHKNKTILKYNHERTVDVNVTLDQEIIDEIRSGKIKSIRIICNSVTLAPENKQVIQINDGHTHNFTNFDQQLRDPPVPLKFNFTVKGTFLGHANVTLDVYTLSSDSPKLNIRGTGYYKVDVIRDQEIFDRLFQGFMILFVCVNYINMGCAMDLEIVKQTLRKPIGPIIGTISQFTIMPLASYAVGYLLFYDQPGVRLGLFTLGCSPGGSASNFWTLLLNGDMDLSITMTFISTILAVGMMPLWLFTLGKTLVREGSRIVIPFKNIFISLISLSVPLILGLLIKRYKPNWAKHSNRFIKPFTVVVVAIILISTSIAYNHFYLMFTWNIVIAGAAITIAGYGLGALMAASFRLPRSSIIAISIETAFQNSGIAFILLQLSIDQPDADISSVPCVAQVVITSQPLWLVFIGIKVWECMEKKKLKKNLQADSCGEPEPGKTLEGAGKGEDGVDVSHISHSGPRRCPLRPPMKTEDAVKLDPDEVSAVHVRI